MSKRGPPTKSLVSMMRKGKTLQDFSSAYADDEESQSNEDDDNEILH